MTFNYSAALVKYFLPCLTDGLTCLKQKGENTVLEVDVAHSRGFL